MNEIRERLTHLEAVVGDDNSNGLRGEVSTLRTKFEAFAERLNRVELRIAFIVGGITVIAKAAEIFLK